MSVVRHLAVNQSSGCCVKGSSHATYPLPAPAKIEVAAGFFTSFNAGDDPRGITVIMGTDEPEMANLRPAYRMTLAFSSCYAIYFHLPPSNPS